MLNISPPILSIVIPVYNTSAYLDKCLRSIFEQAYSGFEVIIIDDGSTDNSLNLCEAWAGRFKNIRIVSKSNEGQGVARNIGISMAKGDYICFVDSDDWIEANFFARALGYFDGPDVDFINFGFDYYSLDGCRFKGFRGFGVSELVGDKIFAQALLDYDVYSSPCNKIYRREFLLANKLQFPPLRANEDLYFSRAVSRVARRTVFCSDVLYHVLVRPGSTTRSMSLDNFRSAESLVRLEHEKFSTDVDGGRFEIHFRAHIVKFFSHMLVMAAFRIDGADDYVQCHAIAARCGFLRYSEDPEVLKLLKPRNKFYARLCRNPKFLRLTAAVMKKFSVVPY